MNLIANEFLREEDRACVLFKNKIKFIKMKIQDSHKENILLLINTKCLFRN